MDAENSFLQWIALFSIGVSLIACSPLEQKQLPADCQHRVSYVYQGPAEKSYCSPTTYTGSTITISGIARYRAYQQDGAKLTNATSKPIRYAEVEILNSAGAKIQCGETDGAGNYSLIIPQGTSTVNAQVNARAFNSHAKASILNCPEENSVHGVRSSSLSNASNQTANLTASETGDTKGGAFNILDQIVNANAFLSGKVSNCSGTYPGCTDVSVADKVSVYWEIGFNPNDYQGDPNNGLSFYLPSYHRLFILGGISGDYDNEDTDHFDNSVIIHEFGHFLEDVYSLSDSPGGRHFGTSQIDPRLAWSEGWGDFIQAAVLNDPHYYDSIGSPIGTIIPGSENAFSIPLENMGTFCSPSQAGCDLPSVLGEGNFREYAITRFLWDIFDTNAAPEDFDNDSVDDEFKELWYLMTSTAGFKNLLQAFRNIGLLLEVQSDDSVGSNWSSVLSAPLNRMDDTKNYARYVDDIGGCGDYNFIPLNDPSNDNGSFSTSNLFHNNDFYFFKHSGGAFNLTLNYTTTDSGGGEETETDLDLFVYKGSARYGNANDMAGYSQDYFDNDQTTSETESISKSLPAGNYLINVKAFTGAWQYSKSNSNYNVCTDSDTGTSCPTGHITCSGNAALGSAAVRLCHDQSIPAGDPLTYSLTLNGVKLCPATRP